MGGSFTIWDFPRIYNRMAYYKILTKTEVCMYDTLYNFYERLLCRSGLR